MVEDATDALEDGATIAGSSQEVLPDDMQTSVSDIAETWQKAAGSVRVSGHRGASIIMLVDFQDGVSKT